MFIMASSIYVYKNIDDFLEYYKGKEDQLIHKIPIIDMYIEPRLEKLFVVTNQDVQQEKKQNIDWFRTIVHIRNEEFIPDMFAREELNPVVVQYGKVFFDGKTGYINFFPRRFRKSLYGQHVDRFIGGMSSQKKYPLKYEHRYYDFLQDRINLILGDVQESGWTRLRLTLERVGRFLNPLNNKLLDSQKTNV